MDTMTSRGNSSSASVESSSTEPQSQPQPAAAADAANGSCREAAAGGLPSISPPAKVKMEVEGLPRVLASGIDSLVLAIDVRWKSRELFDRLEELRGMSIISNRPARGVLRAKGDTEDWHFDIWPHGQRGYSWVLVGGGFAFRIGNWLLPCSRPSVMLEVRSDFLWCLGPEKAVAAALDLIEGEGGEIDYVKVSRVDLCVDLLVSRREWSQDLLPYIVTRALRKSTYIEGDKLTGITVGKNYLMARLYDKAAEIQGKSNKFWMYVIWDISSVPEGAMVLRVEFQSRREVLRVLGIDGIGSFWSKQGELWAYFTREWLKLEDNPGKHHTQRKVLPWWEVVQCGYKGSQNANPAVRAKAVHATENRLFRQLFGLSMSMAAVSELGRRAKLGVVVTFDDFIAMLRKKFEGEYLSDEKVTEEIYSRLARYQNHQEKYRKAVEERRRRDAERGAEGNV